jgi:hypothetical protein
LNGQCNGKYSQAKWNKLHKLEQLHLLEQNQETCDCQAAYVKCEETEIILVAVPDL